MSDASDIYSTAKVLVFRKYENYTNETSTKKQIKIYRDFLALLNCLAVGSVLFNMDKTHFSKHFMRIAEVGKHFLLQQKEKKVAIPSSYNQPLVAALCIQQYDLAKEISDLNPRNKIKPEYKDEFLSNQLIVSLLDSVIQNKSIDIESISSICDEIDDYLDTESLESIFYKVLVDENKNNDDLSDAFIDWHNDLYDDFKYKQQMEKGSAWFPLTGRLWLKGLAIINLCKALNQPINQRLSLIPDLLYNNQFSEIQQDILLGKIMSVSKEEL